eukprot:scaffold259748_cov43-Attheya_sp.AAC.1
MSQYTVRAGGDEPTLQHYSIVHHWTSSLAMHVPYTVHHTRTSCRRHLSFIHHPSRPQHNICTDATWNLCLSNMYLGGAT